MSVYNLTELNDGDNVTGYTDSNKAPALNTTVGQRYEGTGSIETQHTNTAGGNELDTTQTSGGGGTFSVDMSDRTFYFQLKDNLVDTYANQGIMAVFGDGTDKVGFQCGGNDAVGMPVPPFYNVYKFDCSNLPSGSNTTFTGVEANLTLTAITAMGIGTVHLAKAVGNVANVFCDRLAYIANDSYALTIDAGTSGTPETMADVAGDDATNGWGLVGNPLGLQYIFFGPTEWGTPSGTANSYFTADGEQWFLVGDNAGGHAVGATHFPFRLIGNSTGTNSWVVTNTVIINTGTRAELLMDDANMDTITLDGCAVSGLGTIGLPSSGGTSRTTLNTIFSDCDQITNNGADMTGSSVLLSNVAAGSGALLYNEASDPDGELDGMTFSQGAAAHSAIEFGTNVDSTLVNITIRDCDFTGFGSTDDVNGAVFKFLATTGNLNLNLVGCTTDGTFSVDDSAGITVTVVIDPATTKFTVEDENGTAIENARVIVETADNGGAGGFPFEDAVTTLTQSAGTATLTASAVHGLDTGDYVVVRGAQPDGYNKVAQITVTSTTVFTYPVSSGLSSPATGTPIFSYTPIGGLLTNASGIVSSSKTWPSSQSLKGWARKKNTSSPFYQDGPITVADASGGTDQTIILRPDE